AGSAATPLTINVPATDSALKLSAKTAPVGQITFAVRNAGKRDHSFQIAGKKTPVLTPGKSAKLVVTFTKAGPFAYTSTVAGDAARGMKGTFTTKATELSAAGKEAFATAGCGACHALAAAGSTGAVGPNLDRSTASKATILRTVTDGKGTMPSFVDRLTPEQLQDVSEFVFESRSG